MCRALVKLHYMLEHLKALSTHLNNKLDSDNLKDVTMGNQQETKVLYYSGLIGD
jgi:hypothetical protein